MLKMTPEILDWICQQIPDPPESQLGGRPPTDKRKVVAGIFWMLDNGATWKDLPHQFGSKSTVHRWFQKWMEEGVFEHIPRAAGGLVEERDGSTSASSTAPSRVPRAVAMESASPASVKA